MIWSSSPSTYILLSDNPAAARCSAAVLAGEELASDDDSSDDDYNPGMRIGAEYQAEVPPARAERARHGSVDAVEGTLIWAPASMDVDEQGIHI